MKRVWGFVVLIAANAAVRRAVLLLGAAVLGALAGHHPVTKDLCQKYAWCAEHLEVPNVAVSE